jgi:anaerobic ribonucleoside-triphosphate reductase
MRTDITFDKEFDRFYRSIPEDILKLNGISKEYMDVGEMSHNYFTNNWNEGGKIDHNANSNKTCVVNYASEVVKPLMKLEGVYLLHRYLRKSMSSEKADRIIMSVLSGDMYVHDFSGTGIQMPYCFAFSTHWILENGTPFGQLPSTPPKHTRSFIGQVAEMVMTMSQQFAGATAPADVLVAYAHLAKKEHLTAKEIENDLQSLVHILNKEFRGGSQSSYSNVSIFDRPGLEHLFGDMLYSDGTGIDIDYVMFVQEVFMDWFSRGIPETGEPYRFPVVTVNISTDDDGNILDDDFVKLVSKYNLSTGCFNIHSGESSKIASCPLHPDTEVLIDGHKGIQKSKIGNLGKSGKETYSVYINGEFKTGKFIRTKTDEWYKIVLSNGHSVITTPTHLNVTKRGTLKTHELVIGDKIPVSLQPLDEGVGSYNMGYLVGAYVGDGSRTERGGVTFSLNDTTKTHVQESLKQYMENELGSRVNIYNGNRGVVFVTTYSKTVAGIIDEYVVGNNALEKGLKNSVYNCSLEFRQGLYDGLYDTDGGNSHRIYTSSERMVSDISTLVSTLGSCTNINSVDTRDGRYSENPNYCVRTYQALDKRGQYGICERGDGVSWFDIVAIEPYECSHKYAYCFEMDTDEHLFQLANGIITHNCRLTQSLEDMRKYNQDSFGNGGLNIGSTHVVTINLPRIAVRTNYILSESVGEETNEDRKRTITSILERLMNDAALILDTHRNRILSKRIEQGFFPLIDVGLVDVDTMFSTFGFTGVPEFVEILGYDITSEEGIAIAGFVMDKMDELSLKISDEYGYAFNVEEVPAESASVTLRDLDVLKYGDDYADFIGKEMYSNQFIPLTYDVPIIDRVTITGQLMAKATGGAIMHLNLDERITNESTMENLIRWVISKGVQHFAINYGFSRCINGHSTPGIVDKCSDCSGEIEDYLTRIVGYFVPVKSWNKRRQLHDFPNRVAYYVNGDVE